MSGNFDGLTVGLPAQDNLSHNQDNAAFNALLEKNLQSQLESKLQSARVGGYSKKSVEDFVTEMRQSLLQVKTQLERQILDLAAEKASVTQECTVLRTQLKTAVERLADSREQVDNPQHDVEISDAEEELKQYREENERLRSMLNDNQPVSDDTEKYEELLKQKELEIAQLNQTLIKYQDDCNALKDKTEQLENMVRNSSVNENEISELMQQKDEIEGKYQQLLQGMEETNLQLEQRKKHLDESEIELEQRKQRLDESETELEQRKQQLDETIIELEQRKQQLEESEIELEQRKQQLDETETQLAQKRQRLDEMQMLLEQEKAHLTGDRAQLEHKKQQLDEMQMQLEQEKAYLTEARAEMEQKKQQLDEIQLQLEQEEAHLEDTRVQLELKSKQLSEVQAILESEIHAKEYIGRMKDFNFDDGYQLPEDLRDESSGEKLFELLYMHFSQLKGKAEHQESIIAEKEIQLEQYKNLENETIKLRQEHENAKEVIASLKTSFEEVMAEMDEQSETLNLYISRSRKDRETLKTALKDRNTPQSNSTDSIEQQSILAARMEELEEENTQLEEAVLKPYSQILRFDNAKKIIPLNDSGKGQMPEDSEKWNSMKDLTKAADI